MVNCEPASDWDYDGYDGDGEGAEGSARDAQAIQRCSETQKKYVGLGGAELNGDRIEATLGTDRRRVKPYSSLSGEFTRVFGAVPASFQAAAASFSAPQDRWYIEPSSSAVTLHTTYRLAFEAALTYVRTVPAMASAPTEASAAAECATFARKAWSRAALPEEISVCTNLATTGAAGETEPARRWAHALSAIVTSAAFTTY
jgi:hypothetical protein